MQLPYPIWQAARYPELWRFETSIPHNLEYNQQDSLAPNGGCLRLGAKMKTTDDLASLKSVEFDAGIVFSAFRGKAAGAFGKGQAMVCDA